MKLGSSTWPQAEARDGAVLLVPLGSTEQHGPHLPLDTDTRISLAVAERAAATAERAVVAPPLAYGSSGEHQEFPGTLSIGTKALKHMLTELGRSAMGRFSAMVLVCGHAGNIEAAQLAAAILVGEQRPTTLWWPTHADGDAHAGHTETSVLLALDPAAVRVELIDAGTTTPLSDLIDDLRRDGVRSHSPTGVLGDPRSATAEAGRALLARWATELAALVSPGTTGG